MVKEDEIKLVGKGSNTVDFELLNKIANSINLKVDTMQLQNDIVNVVVPLEVEKRNDVYFMHHVIQFFYDAYEAYYYIITQHMKYVINRISG